MCEVLTCVVPALLTLLKNSPERDCWRWKVGGQYGVCACAQVFLGKYLRHLSSEEKQHTTHTHTPTHPACFVIMVASPALALGHQQDFVGGSLLRWSHKSSEAGSQLTQWIKHTLMIKLIRPKQKQQTGRTDKAVWKHLYWFKEESLT